jgi:3-hydroxy acid dehydrogenase/malonic semialdehyde reductase
VADARRVERIADRDGVLPLALAVRDAVRAAVAGLPAEFADIDVLVDNAGPAPSS